MNVDRINATTDRLPRHISWSDFFGLLRTWAALALLSVACEVALLMIKGPHSSGSFSRFLVLYVVPAVVASIPAYAGRWAPKRFPGLKTGIVGVLLYAVVLAAIR